MSIPEITQARITLTSLLSFAIRSNKDEAFVRAMRTFFGNLLANTEALTDMPESRALVTVDLSDIHEKLHAMYEKGGLDRYLAVISLEKVLQNISRDERSQELRDLAEPLARAASEVAFLLGAHMADQADPDNLMRSMVRMETALLDYGQQVASGGRSEAEYFQVELMNNAIHAMLV